MVYTSWGSASWSTSSADGLCVGGNHVASAVASVAVPNRSSLLCMQVQVPGAASGAALTVGAVVASVEVDVGLGEDAEEGTETEVVSEVVEVAAASEVVMTMDHREVEVAIGSCFAE
jgi:hypothetical protein